MAYRVPTPNEMLGFLVAQFKGLFPDRNIGSRFVPAWKLMKVFSTGVTDIHAAVSSAFKDLMPDSASGAGLDRQLAIYAPGGIKTKKPATPARKAAAGRVRGTLASTTVIGDQLVHRASGLLFQVNSNAAIPAALFIDVDILAISTGSATRLKKGEILEYLSPPAGIQTKVELQKDLDDDGFDLELEGAARNRLLDALSTPSAGGNQADYVGWALSMTGISQAFEYSNRAGLGCVDVAGLHTGVGTARIMNAGEVAALLALLQTRAPAPLAASGGALRVLTVIGGNTDAANLANVEVTITPDGQPQNAFDWDDSTPPVILAVTPGTRTIQLNAARPATMQAGHRFCLRGVGSVQDGSTLVIEALVSTDSFIVQTWPTNNPAATDVVYAGGPLTEVVRPAIVSHLNGDVLYAAAAGPLAGAIAASSAISVAQLQVLATGIGTANPGGTYGAWSGSLLPGTLQKIATYTRGVRACAVITPAAAQDAVDYAFPNDSQIGLLTPGYVLVRRG